jgi:hypothetical protein
MAFSMFSILTFCGSTKIEKEKTGEGRAESAGPQERRG